MGCFMSLPKIIQAWRKKGDSILCILDDTKVLTKLVGFDVIHVPYANAEKQLKKLAKRAFECVVMSPLREELLPAVCGVVKPNGLLILEFLDREDWFGRSSELLQKLKQLGFSSTQVVPCRKKRRGAQLLWYVFIAESAKGEKMTDLVPFERESDDITIPAKEAWEQLDEFEKARVNELSSLINSRILEVVNWGWKVGTIVAQIQRHSRSQDRLQLVAAALGLKSTRSLHYAVSVVDRWETKERFDKLVQAATYNGRTLSFSHLVVLSDIIDDDEAFEYAREAIKNAYDYRTLKSLIRGDEERQPRGPGRLPGIPKSVEACIPAILRDVTAMRNRLERSWLADEFNVIEELSQMPEIPTNMLRSLKQLLEHAKSVKEQIGLLIEGIQGIVGNRKH